MTDTITLPDGRTLGFSDPGGDGMPVLWCHGGPGSRLEPTAFPVDSTGLRLVGIDRPGYGASSPKPGRSIADFVPDALAVADHLKLAKFKTFGVSTGGAYALALAALAPERVDSAVACCALTDMRWAPGRKSMHDGAAAIWNAPSRDAAIAMTEEAMGRDGSKMFGGEPDPDAEPMPPADLKLMANPAFVNGFVGTLPVMFAQGVVGYVDDRLADGVGWVSFDVTKIQCKVTVVHGKVDTVVPALQANHTAQIVPDAELRIYGQLGHLSIVPKAIEFLHPH